jgi:hypothetical protein
MQELIQPLDAPIGSTLSCSGRMAWHGFQQDHDGAAIQHPETRLD